MSERKGEWEERTLRRALERMPERKPRFETSSQVPIRPLYTAEDLADWDPTLGLVAGVLADPRLSADDRADFRELLRIVAARWSPAPEA